MCAADERLTWLAKGRGMLAKALRDCAMYAGNPDAAEGCRLVIQCVKSAGVHGSAVTGVTDVSGAKVKTAVRSTSEAESASEDDDVPPRVGGGGE